MGFINKKDKRIDLEKGKRIFFKCKGSFFAIDRDWGSEYYNCNIPKVLEEKWHKEIEASKHV